MAKLIQLPHKVCGMTCMVNGLEDLYEHHTGLRLPDWLFFYGSGLGNGFIYLKAARAPIPRMVLWGNSTHQQYQRLGETVGFDWQLSEGRSFDYAFKKACEAIDRGHPVILGCLDMYHLPYYEKFYHHWHIPIHYVLMVGYDENQQVVFVHDCDRPTPEAVPCSDLRAAWNVHVPGLSKKNTFYTFTFKEKLAAPAAIARDCLQRQARWMLNPPLANFGIRGMQKLARELSHWPEELSPEACEASLRFCAEYTGMPPTPPNRLTGYEAPDHHTAGRDGFAALLTRLAAEYNEPGWKAPAALFAQSGERLCAFTEKLVDAVLGQPEALTEAGAHLLQIAALEEEAYRLLSSNLTMDLS